MPEHDFKTRLKNLVFNKKLILVGSFAAIVGVILPWYQDIDRFNTGDVFFGITGPLYLAGLIVLLSSAACFGLILLKLLDKKAPELPLTEEHFYIFSSALSILMIILTLSVYFHPKFGVNLTDKSMGIGMYFEFVGIGLLLIGGVLNWKKKDVDFNAEGKIEPLINLQDRPQNPIKEPEEMERPTSNYSPYQESLNDFPEKQSDTNDLKHNG